MTDNSLPPGFAIRPATMEDAQAVVDLITAVDAYDHDEENSITLNDLLAEWDHSGFDLASDTWVAVAPAQNGSPEKIVGYEEIYNQNAYALLRGDGYIHPDFRGLGLGTALLHRLEARARDLIPLAPPDRRVVLRNGVSGKDPSSHSLHENEGYQVVRYFWSMRIDLETQPPQPAFPDGITLRTFGPDLEIRAVFDALQEAFRDHWGFVPWDYENWLRRNIEIPEYDPELVFLAMDGDQIAGISLCREREGRGWVSSLGVRRAWRRRGIALALLYTSFGAFYSRGYRQVGLGVDASNPTGATHLYEKAGMRPIFDVRAYEKELRPGREAAEE